MVTNLQFNDLILSLFETANILFTVTDPVINIIANTILLSVVVVNVSYLGFISLSKLVQLGRSVLFGAATGAAYSAGKYGMKTVIDNANKNGGSNNSNGNSGGSNNSNNNSGESNNNNSSGSNKQK